MTKEFNLKEELSAEQLHNWYLEAVKGLDEENYNREARKPFNELSDGQRFIDCFIAEQIWKKIQEKIKELKEKLHKRVHDGNNLNITDAEFEVDKIFGEEDGKKSD